MAKDAENEEKTKKTKRKKGRMRPSPNQRSALYGKSLMRCRELKEQL
jgi:hypothetical protein